MSLLTSIAGGMVLLLKFFMIIHVKYLFLSIKIINDKYLFLCQFDDHFGKFDILNYD